MNDVELDQLLDTWEAPAPPPSLRRGLVAAFPVKRWKVFGIPLRWIVAGAAAAVVCAAVGAGLFNPEIGRFYGRFDSGLYMKTTRLVDPPQASMHWWMTGCAFSVGGGATPHVTSQLRVRQSRTSFFSPRTIYAYQYTLEPLGGGQFQASFSPLQPSSGAELYKSQDTWVQPPSLPSEQAVQVDKPFEVTLYQDSSQRVYDRIVLSWSSFPEWPPKQPAAARRGNLQAVAPQLYVNGQLLTTGDRNVGSGPVLWFHLPGEGRYLMALNPLGNTRFVQSGHVNGNTLEFQSGGKDFRIVCAQPIAAGGDQPVYVYHQQSFEDVLNPAHPLADRPFFGNAGPASLHQD